MHKLTQDEQENLDELKEHFMGELEGFEEEEMEVHAFGMDNWDN